MEAAAERAESAAMRRACLEGAANALKRGRQYAEADAAWERLADEGGASAEALRALIEMAKHAEHRLRDCDRATRACRRASALQETMEALGALEHVPLAQRVRWADDLARREARLARRAEAERERGRVAKARRPTEQASLPSAPSDPPPDPPSPTLD
jgi:ABC-type nitrate/sulfonate/bicarbonate transport system substrate-binding protein